MAKWVFLFFVVALVAAGWFASQDDAPGWAPVAPTLVIAAGVATGLVYAIRWGLRRRKEMGQAAAQLGFAFEKDKKELRNSGISALKQFAHCRPVSDLPFLRRGVRTGFANVMSTFAEGAEIHLFDYTTSVGSNNSPTYHGFFAAFRVPGAAHPDAEIVPRLWGEQPAWTRYFTELPPTRTEVEVQHPSFTVEYMVQSAEPTAARERLSNALLDHLATPGRTGWRIEMSGEWVAITRLGPGKKIGGLADPMEPEKVPAHERHSYHADYIAPKHVPRFHEEALRIFRVFTGR